MYRSTLLIALALFASPANAQSRTQDAAALRAAARTYREAHEGTILKEFSDLLSIPNVATDRANIKRNADLLIRMLERRGVTARTLDIPDGNAAVYGEIKVPGATKTLVLYAHYDGQPIDSTQWVTKPFAPVLRDKALFNGGKVIDMPADGQHADTNNRIYARSASDDKGSIISMLTALDAMKAAGRQPSVNLKFFFEGEEEAGSTHLMEILEKYKDVLAADAWLFCDGPVHQSGRSQVVFGARGITGLELIVYGPTRPLHSGHYGNWAPNPGALLANIVASMRDDDGHIRIAGYYDDVRPISAAEKRALAAIPPVDAELRKSLGLARTEANNARLEERIMMPALNVRGLAVGAPGAQSANAISTEARGSFDFRLVPNQDPQRVQKLVIAHLRKLGYFVTEDSVTMEVRMSHARIVKLSWENGYRPSRASMGTGLGNALVQAVADGVGYQPYAVPTLGGSGPNYMFEQVLKVPVIVLPMANYDNNQHASNENLRIGNLWNAIEMYVGVMGRIGDYWGKPMP